MGANTKKRLEQNYVEAVALMADLKGVRAKAVIVAEALIDNLSMRLEWQAAENRRRNRAALTKGEPAPPPIVTMAELETIGRIVTILQDPKIDAFSAEDPDAGMREIVRVLEEARKEFGINEQKSINNQEAEANANAEEAPEDVNEMDDDQGDKICQTQTVERLQEPRHRILGHGKVRRGSG